MYIDLIKPDESKGFSCPYLLYLPTENCSGKHLVVEMCNSRVRHNPVDSIKSQIEMFVCPDAFMASYKKVLMKCDTPMIMPIFPRPKVAEVDNGDICVLEFNHVAMETNYPGLKRMDLQTIAMIEDANQRLSQRGVNVLDKVVLTGYSSSAQFALRFSTIYPELVSGVVAGGFNGFGTLPQASYNGEPANFPIGVNDIEQKFGKKFTEEEFSKIKFFLYMGENDRHPYHSPFTVGKEATGFVERNFPGDIINDRLPKYLSVLKSHAQVEFMPVKDCGHCIGNKIHDDDRFRQDFEHIYTRVINSCQPQPIKEMDNGREMER